MDKTIFPEKAAERSIVHIMRVDFLSYSKYSPDKISGFRAVKGKSLGLLVAHILTVQKKMFSSESRKVYMSLPSQNWISPATDLSPKKSTPQRQGGSHEG